MLYRTNNPHGGDIYEEKIRLDYSANTNPLGTPRGVLESIAEVLPRVHHYPDPYCRGLVKAVSEYEEVMEEYVLCGNGAAELIYSYCEAVHPKRAVETAPTFSEYASALERLGCAVERYVLKQSTEFELDEDFLCYLENKMPEVVFLCNPNNPTGKTVSPFLLKKILSFCKENNTRLFIDECFLDLTDNGISLKGCLSQYPQLFILKAFTKSYGMAGIRLGYCMSADTHLLAQMSKTVQPWNVSLLAQAAGAAALREKQFLERTRSLIAAERNWLKDELTSLGFWVCPSDANYLLFYGKANLDTELKKRGIAIRSCENFHGLTAGWYRIAVRLHEENEMLVAAMKSVCEKR